MNVTELREKLDDFGGGVPVVIFDGNTYYEIEVLDANLRGVVHVALCLTDMPEDDDDVDN